MAVKKRPTKWLTTLAAVNVLGAVCGIWSGTWWNLALAVANAACVVWALRERARQRTPTPPENVRLVRADGTEIPLELLYTGWVNGCHHWVAVTPVDAGEGWQLWANRLPGKTSIQFEARVDTT